MYLGSSLLLSAQTSFYLEDNPPTNQVSKYKLAKLFYQVKITRNAYFKDFFLILIGIFSASFGIKGFLLNNNFIDGGVTGVSLLLTMLTNYPVYAFVILINIPFIVLGYKIMGKLFAIKTMLAIIGLAICLAIVKFPIITQDSILISVFGGFFLGMGIGLSIRGGAVIDGTEILAIFLSRKFGTTIGDIILIINILIFSAAAYFLSVEIALYSIITYLSASKTLDFIVEGIEEYMGVTIISAHHEEIKKMIIYDLGRGLTIYNGKHGYGKKGESVNVDIIYTVVTRLELNRLNVEVKKIDPNAFIVMNSVKDTHGGMIKKRPLK